DEGQASVGGADVLRQPEEVRRLLGYVPDFFGVYDDLRVGEYIELYGQLHGVRGAARPTLRDELLALVDLADKRDDYVEALSRGMQQRLCLARALVHDPPVLLLDEPASGLDPVARVEMRELLKELSRMGKTILISSHILSELADLCTHVGMVAGGRLVREGPVGELLAPSARPGFVLRLLPDSSAGGERAAERAARALGELPFVSDLRIEDDPSGEAGPSEVRFRCAGAEDAASALAAVVRAGVPVVRFAEAEGSLEQAFIRLAREGVRTP
ncbi:MAG TPA: ABC transporter ATP-binding protein, partial [Chloroflexota bacterium]|nr:ABC transporter ATP-binding protein [Chloroflexota bacterium]